MNVLLLFAASLLVLAFYIVSITIRSQKRSRARAAGSGSKNANESKNIQKSDTNLKKVTRAQRIRKEALEFGGHFETVALPRRVLLLYGTEYGFSKEVARKVAQELVARFDDIVPRIVSMAHFQLVDLSKESLTCVISSTTGDGVVPNDAREFHEELSIGIEEDLIVADSSVSDRSIAPCDKTNTSARFHNLNQKNRFGVIALGDRGYPHFCRAGLIFEGLLSAHTQNKPVVDTAMIDQEDWGAIDSWIEDLCNVVDTNPEICQFSGEENDYFLDNLDAMDAADEIAASKSTNQANGIMVNGSHFDERGVTYTRDDPFFARLVERSPLTTQVEAHDKETIHVEFDIRGSGMNYMCGDALGVQPSNCPSLVDEILIALAANNDELVRVNGENVRAQDALLSLLDVNNLKPEILLLISGMIRSDAERKKMEELVEDADSHGRSEKVLAYLATRNLSDVISDFSSAPVELSDLIPLLKPLLPRYYSISSSPEISKDSTGFPTRVSITVAVVRYQAHGKPRKGVATTFLSDRAELIDTSETGDVATQRLVPIFVSRNVDFRLPKEPSTPIIMIGPGTGVAPFRAFLQERLNSESAKQYSDNNWLFFGCRHETRDFLYGSDFQRYASDGLLQLRVAFSRDIPGEKVYVQHLLTKEGEALWKLIHEEGAHVYVCGDAGQMARDVHAALVDIIALHSQVDNDVAERYIQNLEKQHRYQRDVWAS